MDISGRIDGNVFGVSSKGSQVSSCEFRVSCKGEVFVRRMQYERIIFYVVYEVMFYYNRGI